MGTKALLIFGVAIISIVFAAAFLLKPSFNTQPDPTPPTHSPQSTKKDLPKQPDLKDRYPSKTPAPVGPPVATPADQASPSTAVNQ